MPPHPAPLGQSLSADHTARAAVMLCRAPMALAIVGGRTAARRNRNRKLTPTANLNLTLTQARIPSSRDWAASASPSARTHPTGSVACTTKACRQHAGSRSIVPDIAPGPGRPSHIRHVPNPIFSGQHQSSTCSRPPSNRHLTAWQYTRCTGGAAAVHCPKRPACGAVGPVGGDCSRSQSEVAPAHVRARWGSRAAQNRARRK